MTKRQLASAIRQLRAVNENAIRSLDCDNGDALVAHAAARMLLALPPHKSSDQFEDLLRFISNWCDLPAAMHPKDFEHPTAQEIAAIAAHLSGLPLPETALHRRLANLCDLLRLDSTDLVILVCFATMYCERSMRRLMHQTPYATVGFTISSLGLASGLDAGELSRRLARNERLVVMGLVADDGDGDYRVGPLLRGVIERQGETRRDIEHFVLPDAEDTSLTWEDFHHLGPMRDLAEQIMQAGRPVSILLYGEPGTGKSEFARALARQARRGASFAGVVGAKDSNEPKRDERLAHLAMLRTICAERSNRIVVVDEADDVLSLARERHASKQFVNRLIDDPKVPTIWIVNDPESLDSTAVRRMLLAIRFERPSPTVRRRIVERAAIAEGLALEPDAAERLASLPANAAVIAAGIRAACLSGGGAVEAERATDSVLQALGGRHRPEITREFAYRADFSAADTDLAALADRLVAAPQRGWSLLLSGPSGTGKSAFARDLGNRLGIEIELQRGSDLLGPFVGETEARIAAAFAKAARRGAMLVIDEADSFLYRREDSHRSWEVSLVNEMLCQMESLETPFIATTNLASRLDPATQRRFTLRVSFRTMSARQAKALFVSRFGVPWPSGEPPAHDQTPGDFSVVAARARLLGETDPRQLVRWLREEAAVRKSGTGNPIGFRIPNSEKIPKA